MILKGLYIGVDHPELKGKTCLILTVNNDNDTFGVQFDDRALGHWSNGRHVMPADDFHTQDVNQWFGLSYATWLTMPRVLMQEMPLEWQLQMTKLLDEYEQAYPEAPEIHTQVRTCDRRNKLVRTPDWITNYRRTDQQLIQSFRGSK